MSRSRSTLHIKKLPLFRQWLAEERGWEEVPTKSIYEKLRMVKQTGSSKETLIVHQRDKAIEHCTTWGISQRMLCDWLRGRRQHDAGKRTDR